MLKIDGKTRVCGLMGNPVEHTLSPLIHNTLAAQKGHNLVYIPLKVEQNAIQDAIRGAAALHFLGVNVTVPHKSAVIPYLKETDELAAKIGAVNTLVRCEGGFKGCNTDMSGLLRAMKDDGIQLKDETVIVLGAGGAARAVAFLCVYEGAKQVYLLNRTMERAQAVAKEVNTCFGKECVTPLLLTEYDWIPKGKYLAIQATSVGLYPNTQEAVITDNAFYRKIHTGYDLIYRPFETKFMQLVEAHGGKAYNGLKMLAFQAISAYEMWNDTSISADEAEHVLQVLKEEVKTE